MRVLLVDDDPVIAQAICGYLRRAAVVVYWARDGAEALRVFPTYSPNLLITDLLMPEMDGIELIVNLRKLGQSIPILAYSGGPVVNLDFAVGLGANGGFSKPINLSELLEKVHFFERNNPSLDECFNSPLSTAIQPITNYQLPI